MSCSDLTLGGKSDTFVRVFLIPGTHKELKTRVVKGDLNPVFNDEFSFEVSSIFLLWFKSSRNVFLAVTPINVRKKTIIFQLFDTDTFGADGIGEVLVPLWQISSLEAGVEETKELALITMDKNNVPL